MFCAVYWGGRRPIDEKHSSIGRRNEGEAFQVRSGTPKTGCIHERMSQIDEPIDS
jgi:hypothetical protein